MAVTTPTGNWAGATTTRAKVSAATRKTAPETALKGISWRWSGPDTSLTAWGTIRPTNPIRPLRLTAKAVTAAAAANAMVRVRETFMPMLFASSWPKLRTFRSALMK